MSKKAFVEFNQETQTLDISDGYHTMDELYYHRTVLFSVIANLHRDRSYKSWKHEDGSMFDDMFIAVIKTANGDYSYHCDAKYWDLFKIPEREFAEKWDGHLPKDVDRLFSL